MPLRRDARIASLVTAGLDTIALRIPAHPAMQALLTEAGPLAAPSANASGSISPTRAEHVLKSLGGRIALIVDGGATLITGGTVVGRKESRSGEVSGTDLQNGQMHRLRKGDVVVVPAGTPHWWQEVQPTITLYQVNVEVAGSATPTR